MDCPTTEPAIGITANQTRSIPLSPMEEDGSESSLPREGWSKTAVLAGALLFAAAIGLALLAGTFTAQHGKAAGIRPVKPVVPAPGAPIRAVTAKQGLEDVLKEAPAAPVTHAVRPEPIRRPVMRAERAPLPAAAEPARTDPTYQGLNSNLEDRINKMAEPEHAPAASNPTTLTPLDTLKIRIDQRLKLRDKLKNTLYSRNYRASNLTRR